MSAALVGTQRRHVPGCRRDRVVPSPLDLDPCRLRPHGRVVAPHSVEPADLLRAVAATRRPKVLIALAPSDTSGWFGGTSLVAWSDTESLGMGAAEAASVLERIAGASRPELAAAVLPYDEGPARVAEFGRGMLRTQAGWQAWGALSAPELAEIVAALETTPATAPLFGRLGRGPLLSDVTGDTTRARFVAAVEHTREQIAAGNVYVANITYRLAGTLRSDPSAIFRALVQRASAPMAAALLTAEHALLSVSPERFVGISYRPDGTRTAEVWPIKGTRPREEDPSTDSARAAELAADPKERAEHVMIVDLERNDLGRVCVPGTVVVDPFAWVFPTPYCHQMTSRVTGALRPDVALLDVLTATFPCGSVTGAPKVAAMHLIERLESSGRGAYCGSLVVAAPGVLDSSVLIRTLECNGEQARWGTGCGITYDSDASAEWDESVLKTWPVTGSEADASTPSDLPSGGAVYDSSAGSEG